MDSSFKRFLALVLAASMVFSIMATTVSAAESVPERLGPDMGVEEVHPSLPVTTEPTMPQVTDPALDVPEDTVPSEQKEIERIEVLPLTLYPYTDGQWVDSYYQYLWQNRAQLVFWFTDGTSEILREFPASNFQVGEDRWTFYVRDNQQTDHWQPGYTYKVNVTLTNKTTGQQYNAASSVTIAETAPLVSLSVQPVTIYEGEYLYRDYDGNWIYDFSQLIQFRAEFDGGVIIEERDNCFNYLDQWYWFDIRHDSTFDNPWQPGIHYVEVSVMGQTAQMEVTVLESPVKNITFDPLYIIEGQLGGTIEPELGEPYFFYDWRHQLSFTVEFKDGTSQRVTQSGGLNYADRYFVFCSDDSQRTEHWYAGDCVSTKIYIFNTSYDVQVNIVDNPVSGVSVDDITVHMNMDSYLDYDYIDQPDGSSEQKYYQRYSWDNKLSGTIYCLDGSQIPFTGEGFRYRDVDYTVSCQDDQSALSAWTEGTTYKAFVKVLGKTVPVQVTVAGSLIKELEFYPVSLVEYGKGNYDNEYFQYHWWDSLRYRIVFSDGTVHEEEGSSFYYNDCWYGFTWEDVQSAENPWTAGKTYYVEVSAFDVTATAAFTIEESPVREFIVQPITMIENCNGWWDMRYNPDTGKDEEFFRYDWWNYMQTSAYIEGVGWVSGDLGIYVNGHYEYVNTYENQYANPLYVGNTYYEEVSFLGKTATVEITIVENPLKSITLTPVTMLEYTGGWDAGGYYHYDFANYTTATLVFIDEVIVVENINDGYYYRGQHYWFDIYSNQSAESPWTVGTEGIGYVQSMGIVGTAQVTIEPFGVKSLTVEPIALGENRDGWPSYSYNEYGEWVSYFYYNWTDYLQFTVTLENGEVINGTGSGFYYMGNWFSMQYENPQSAHNQWYGGNTYIVPLSLAGVSTDVYVQIVPMNQENGYEYMVQSDMAFITNSWITEGMVYVPETLGGYPVRGIQNLGWETRENAVHLYIPDSVTMLGENLFASGETGWRNLRTVSLGSGVTALHMEMFVGCKQLEAIDVSKANDCYYSEDGVIYSKDMTQVVVFPLAKTGTYYLPESVQNADAIFENLGQIQATIEFEQVDGYVKENGVVYNEDKTVVIAVDSSLTGSYIMPDSVTQIKRFAFKDSNLSHVTVSKNVTSIVYYSFYNSNIQSISLPDSITAIEIGAFEDTKYLTEINIPANLERLGCKAFANSGITSVTVPGSVRQIENEAFCNSDLEELVLCEGVESIYYLAFANTKIRNLVIPDSVTYMDDAFNGCHELRSLTVGNGLEDIGGFQNCYQLTEVHLGDHIKNIGMHAFRGCPITELTLGDNVWHIFGFAFDGADLETLELPDTVTYIAYRAFGGNSRVQSISLPENLTRLSYKAFEDTGWYNAQPAGHVYLDGFYYNYKGQLPENAVLYLDENTRGVADELQMDHDLSAVIFRGDAPEHLQLSNVTVVYPADNDTWDIENYYNYNLTWIAAVATGQCGENAYWALDENGCLHIMGSGAMADYGYGSAPWYASRNEIRSVQIASSITHVGSYSFVFMSDVNVTFEADAPTFGDNCFAATNATIQYPTNCDGWENVVGSHFGGELTWDIMDDIYADGRCGENLYWTLDISGTLTISGNGYMEYGDWSAFGSSIKRVVIQEGVQCIADGVFSDMRYLEKVTVPASVEYIGCNTFQYCIALKQVIISENSAMYRIGAGCFQGCSALEYIRLPQNLQQIEYGVFAECTSLKEVQLPDSIYEIQDYAFNGCIALESAVIPDGVTYLGFAAFMDCVSLSYVQMPQSIHELAYDVFRNCISLKSITLPDELTSLTGSFRGSAVESITLPATLTELGSAAFRNCADLQEVTFLGSRPTIAKNAFENVTAIVYYNGDDESWENIEYDNFGGNLTWTPVFNYIAEGECGEDITWHLKQDGTLVFKGSGVMDNFTRGDAPWSAYADQVIDVRLNDVNTIGDYAFYGCDQLLRVSSNWVTDIGRSAFEGCTGLMHYGIDGLQRMGDYAFAGCSGLVDFEFPVDMQSIGSHAFHGCTGLKQVFINNDAQLGDYVFQNCTGLEMADLAYNCVVTKGMFSGCVNLQTVYMSRAMTAIGDEAFLNCEKLSQIYLDKNVSYIGDFAFFGCSSLTGLQIPEKVTYVGSFALHSCENLQTVLFLGDAPQFGYQPLSNIHGELVYFENTNGWSQELIASLGGTVTAIHKQKTYVSIFRNGAYIAAYETMEQALEHYDAATDYLYVSFDLNLDITLTQDLYLDLHGNDVSGIIRTNGYKVYLVDGNTDNYNADAIGYLNCADENGQNLKPEKVVYMTEARYGRIARYMTIETDRGWTSHRFYMGITHTSLKPDSVGMGYKSEFYGDEMVMAQIDSIGYTLQIAGGVKRTYSKRLEDMYSGKQVSLRINNWDIPNYGETELYAQVCLRLWDGTVVESATYAATMRGALESMNAMLAANPDSYTDAQIKAVQDMLMPYWDALEGWEMDAIRDRVTVVDPMQFNPNMEYVKYTLGTTQKPDGTGTMECVWKTYLNPSENGVWSTIYSAEPWGENLPTITYDGRTWYSFAGAGDLAYWETNEYYVDFFLDTDERELIRCELLSDGSLRVVYTEAWFQVGDILQAEAIPPKLQMGTYMARVIGEFAHDDGSDELDYDVCYDEAVIEYGLSFAPEGIGGIWKGNIYLPDKEWAFDPSADLPYIVYDDRIWYLWGGREGSGTNYWVSGTTVTVCWEDTTEVCAVCELQADGSLLVTSAEHLLKPGMVLYYEG